MAVLRSCDGIAPRALEFAILTAARPGEVRGMAWAAAWDTYLGWAQHANTGADIIALHPKRA